MELTPFHLLASLGVLLAIMEVFTANFSMLPAGLGFLFTAPWALVTGEWPKLLGLLALHLFATYAISYFFIWPRLKKNAPKTAATGMIGQIATVTEAIGGSSEPGYVQLYGDSWRAMSDESFPVGSKVAILRLDGNKVVVGPVQA